MRKSKQIPQSEIDSFNRNIVRFGVLATLKEQGLEEKHFVEDPDLITIEMLRANFWEANRLEKSPALFERVKQELLTDAKQTLTKKAEKSQTQKKVKTWHKRYQAIKANLKKKLPYWLFH